MNSSTVRCPGSPVGQWDSDHRFECSCCGRRIAKLGYTFNLAPHKAPASVVSAFWQRRRELDAAHEAEQARRAKVAIVTVALDGKTVEFELNGDELSRIDLGHGYVNRYLNNASREHVADEVEKALLQLTESDK